MPKKVPATALAGDWEKNEDIRVQARNQQAVTGLQTWNDSTETDAVADVFLFYFIELV